MSCSGDFMVLSRQSMRFIGDFMGPPWCRHGGVHGAFVEVYARFHVGLT